VGLSQKARYDFSGLSGHPIFDVGMATTQLGGTVILRPMGRNPNGSPKVFFVEAGGAYTRLSFSETQDRSGGSAPSPTWSSGSMMALVGGGFTFRVGPRATMVLFARYSIAMKEYTSAGLTDWNSAPPPDIPKKVNLLMIGAGLRTGR